MNTMIQKLFTKARKPFFLWFLDSEMEKNFTDYIESERQSQNNKFGSIILLAQMIIVEGLQIYEFSISVPGHPRYKFTNELIAFICTNIAIILEVIIYLSNLFPKIRGCILILGYYILFTETALNIISCYAVTLGDLLVIILTIFIGLVINKYFIFPSISVAIGTIYFMGWFFSKANMTIYQLLLALLTCFSIGFWNIYIFYHNEYILRKDFFILELAKGKHKHLKKVLQVIPISIFTRKNGKINFLNTTLKELLNITKHEENDLKLTPKEERFHKLEKYLDELKKEDDNIPLPLCIKNENYSMQDLNSFNFSIIINNNKINLKITGVQISDIKGTVDIYVIEDISNLLRIQTMTEKKYQQIIVASVSHEILTPTNGAIGMLEEIIPIANTKKIKKCLSIIQKSFVKLIFFVNTLKEFSIIENKLIALLNMEINIIECIQSCLLLFEKDLKKKKISLKISYEYPYMQANIDKNKFTLICFCLIANATKHTFEGSITIGAYYIENNSKFAFEVEDTGCGIDEETQKTLFTINMNSKLRNDLNPQGIGLQLYVCKKLSETMNGTIEVKSKLGFGTKFSFIFPVNMNVEKDQKDICIVNSLSSRYLINDMPFNKLAGFNIEEDQLRKFQIPALPKCTCNKYLIVDDDPTNIKVLQNYFNSVNKKCDVAYNGKIAVEKVITQNSRNCCSGYNLIFMDLNMPVMDGEEATRIISRKIISHEIHECIIVAISAAQILDSNHHQKFIDAGFTEIFSKPLSKKHLT